MKKFFMKGSDDELKFGDTIELDFTKDTADGHTCHHHLECKFLPELISLLLEKGIIEMQEFEDEHSKGEDNQNNEGYAMLQDVISTVETLELKVEKLEKIVTALHSIVKKLQHKDVRKSA